MIPVNEKTDREYLIIQLKAARELIFRSRQIS